MSDRPVFAGPLPHAIAHRGSRLLWPENTMTAFSGAIEMGFGWLETDLHLSRDGVLVCLHDDTLDRTTDGSGLVWDRDFADLQELDAGYRHLNEGRPRFRGTGVRIPSLEEVVLAFPWVRIVADLKQDGLEEPLAELVERRDLWDRLVVGSFSDARLLRFRELTNDRVATSLGPGAMRRVWQTSWRGTPPSLGDAVQVPTSFRRVPVVTTRTVRAFHRAGYVVHVWTVNRRGQMVRLLDLGVDGIITDRPDLLKAVLAERGEWASAE